MKRTNLIRYALIGTFFGIMFPVGGTLWDVLFIRELPLTIANLIDAQLTNPMHWIIDSAPLMLGSFAAYAGSRQDQVEGLASSLTKQLSESNELAEALENARNSLESDVSDRTKDLQRKAQFLEAAASVGQAATSINNLDELLPEVTQLISERFGFYHAGIFLIDANGEYAVLRAANSEGGQRMLDRVHRLKVGEQGIVGYVSGTGEGRVALDVGADVTHFDNPDLPETRSEMGLPLYSRGKLFGVLDVQSKAGNAFTDEDIEALRVLADQVAMAINNAQLFEELNKSVLAERKAYGELTRDSWKRLLVNRGDVGYQFKGNTISVSTKDLTSDMQKSITSGDSVESAIGDSVSLTLPIKLSDQTLGAIRVSKSGAGSTWTTDEMELLTDIIEQLGHTLDSARLYEETQRNAMSEQVISDISSRSRETLDINEILRTTAEEVRKSLNLPEVSVKLAPTSSSLQTPSSNGQNIE